MGLFLTELHLPLSDLIKFLTLMNTPQRIKIRHPSSNINELICYLSINDSHRKEEEVTYSIARGCTTFMSEGWREDLMEYRTTGLSIEMFVKRKLGENYAANQIKKPLVLKGTMPRARAFQLIHKNFNVFFGSDSSEIAEGYDKPLPSNVKPIKWLSMSDLDIYRVFSQIDSGLRMIHWTSMTSEVQRKITSINQSMDKRLLPQRTSILKAVDLINLKGNPPINTKPLQDSSIFLG